MNATQVVVRRPFSIVMTLKGGKRVVKSFIRAVDLYEFWERNRTRKPNEDKAT